MLISHTVATVGLLMIGALAVGAALWGGVDVRDALTNILACRPAALDTSAFWLVGAIGIAFFPLLSVTRSEWFHKLVLAAAVIAFVGLPITTFFALDWVRGDRGYVAVTGTWSLLNWNAVELQAPDCPQ